MRIAGNPARNAGTHKDMSKVLYFFLTFLESGLAIFGIRAPFEQPPYQVTERIGGGVEIRAYGPLVAAETDIGTEEGTAFSRLFRYISGGNRGDAKIAMTAPVEMRGASALDAKSMAGTMRFFVPAKLAADPPPPTDPRVRIVRLEPHTTAVLRFSGRFARDNIARHEAELMAAVKRSGRSPAAGPYVMGYDPPFTIPFLRRNEVAVDLRP